VPDPPPAAAGVVAVVAGDGNRRLFESLGATGIVEGGQMMNPSAAELQVAVDETNAPEAILLPNNDNVVLAAGQAASLATKPARASTSAFLATSRSRGAPSSSPLRGRSWSACWPSRVRS